MLTPAGTLSPGIDDVNCREFPFVRLPQNHHADSANPQARSHTMKGMLSNVVSCFDIASLTIQIFAEYNACTKIPTNLAVSATRR